jgi:serine/threonine-protein kinase
LSGVTLGGKYRLERRIAEGGMGSVWLAVHLALGINVAVKFVHPHLAEIADYASFEREARAAAQLRSDHIVRVYDHGLTEQASPYLVMEYLNGESLSARLNRLGPLSPTDVLAFVTQASLALGEAHGHGIIHGDVKPENVLFEDVDRHGEFRMKLVDFGLAKRIEPGRGRDGRTVAGTPSYMSPECLGGAVQPDTFLDMWGLAASAFDAMTGQTAFIGTTLRDTVARVCEAPLPVPSTVNPNVPAGFDAWFARACAREPSARFQTPAEMVAALKAAHDAIVPRELRNLPRSQGALGFAPTEPDAGDPSRNGPLIPT